MDVRGLSACADLLKPERTVTYRNHVRQKIEKALKGLGALLTNGRSPLEAAPWRRPQIAPRNG